MKRLIITTKPWFQKFCELNQLTGIDDYDIDPSPTPAATLGRFVVVAGRLAPELRPGTIGRIEVRAPLEDIPEEARCRQLTDVERQTYIYEWPGVPTGATGLPRSQRRETT